MLRTRPTATLRCTLGLVAIATIVAPPVTGQATQDGTVYRLVELNGPNGDSGSKAYGLNETGQVIGWTAQGENRHSTHWYNDDVADLHATPHLSLLQIFNLDYSEAFALSNGDEAVGAGLVEIECGNEKITVMHAMLVRPAVLTDLGTPIPGDALTDFGTFGDPCVILDSAAIDISNRNHVVGWSDVGGGTIHAWLVTPRNGRWVIDGNGDFANDIMISLGTLSPSSTVSSATAVNDFGEVTGYSYTSQAAYHAFVVQPLDSDADTVGDVWFQDLDGDAVNDLMVDMGTLGGTNSWGRGINNSGQIVGESDTAELTTHAFLWQTGTMIDLGTLGGRSSSAAFINENGQIVGWAETARGTRHAFLWDNGQMIDLNDMLLYTTRLVLAEAREINEYGQIAGWGFLPGSDTPQAFLLTPATADEIAEAAAQDQPNNNDDNQGGATDDPANPFNEGPGTNPFTGVPMLGTPGALSSRSGDTNTDSDSVTGDGDTAGSPALCGFGAVGMLPLCVIGLGALRPGWRRRSA